MSLQNNSSQVPNQTANITPAHPGAENNQIPKKNYNLFFLGFRVGLAALLATNSIVAFVDPESFKSLLESNFIGGQLPAGLLDIMVIFAGINDAVLAVLVLINKWKHIVYLWIGLWFALIAGVKITNLIF
ncbi:hypothetical protein KC950_02180 [Candidatus Saccharibacteria bacterium]|nr:hypothetical protein [Candidatus Saccharibacteria bacterium]